MIYDAAALSRSRDGDQQCGHRHHSRHSVYHHPRLQRPYLDSSVALLPIHRGQRPAKFADAKLIRVRAVRAAAPPMSGRRPASILGHPVQRHHVLKLIV